MDVCIVVCQAAPHARETLKPPGAVHLPSHIHVESSNLLLLRLTFRNLTTSCPCPTTSTVSLFPFLLIQISLTLAGTIWAAVHAFERTQTPTYPQRFPNIDAAKLFIQTLCDAAAFDYGLPLAYNLRASDPHHIVWLVKDRVCFLVAVRAHDQGEFYLDEALPNRQKLRGTFLDPRAVARTYLHLLKADTHRCRRS